MVRPASPSYDRAGVGIGIAHIGVGGFHRAHQAVYIDQLLQRGLAREWGICGIGVMPADRWLRDVQDGLYTIVVQHADGTQETRVIGSIVDYRYAPDDPEATIEVLAAPSTRIISLTITEGGYQGDGPAFDLISAALARRRDRGIASPTIVSCDNIEANGEVARRAVIAHAARFSGLAEWIATHTRFPNSMVDRITPRSTPDLVVTEAFSAWVLEDNFSAGRPPLETVGVLLVDDVGPYEAMKLRLLNAGHQCLCYFAHLCGYRFVHEAASDPILAEFLVRYWAFEAIPTLAPVPGIDLRDYIHTLIQRFTNPGVRDTVARLCAYSSDRIPKWLLPVVRENLASDGTIRLAAAAVASWARYAEGVDEQGAPIEVVDRVPSSAVSLDNTALFGDLAHHPRFVTAYCSALESLHRNGARATLEMLLA
jgi:mannitol 2-dehydrogenase